MYHTPIISNTLLFLTPPMLCTTIAKENFNTQVDNQGPKESKGIGNEHKHYEIVVTKKVQT
jgi:hypothetical protein